MTSRVFFLGLLYDAEIESALLENSRVGLQAAANQYQWGLIEGLSLVIDEPLDVVGSYPTGAFPRMSRQLFFPSRRVQPSPRISIVYPAFLNIWILRELVRSIAMFHVMKERLRRRSHSTIVVYSLQVGFALIVRHVKRHYPWVHVTLVVPDLPGKLGLRPKWWTPRGVWGILTGPLISRLISDADSFVLLSDPMRQVLEIGERPNVVVEGFCPEVPEDTPIARHEHKNVVAYTGALDLAFGLGDLLEAFTLLPEDDYELWIAGDGPARSYIETQVKSRRNIRYFGYLDKAHVEDLQRRSTLLVNPRRSEGLYTRYSFPSKTLVYLAAGRPVIAHRLEGIPDDYDAHLIYIRGETPESLAARIEEICGLGDETLDRMGRDGRAWALSEKSSLNQARRVVRLWD